MRPRFLFGAWATLLTACGSSPGTGLFGGEHGIHPGPTPDAGKHPEAGTGGKVAEGSGGQTVSAGGAAGRPASGTGGARPSAGGARNNGGAFGASGGNDPLGTGGGTIGTGGDTSGGSAGAGGNQTVNGGSAGATPHTVPCGAKPCAVGSTLTSACCLSPVSPATVCIPTLGAGCANGGTALTCDDAADCMAGEICCADSAGNQLVTVCLKDCKDGAEQLCRTDGECRNGGVCAPFDTQPDFSHCK